MSGPYTKLPEGWAVANLGDIVDRLQYGFTTKSSPDLKAPKLLRITDIKGDGVDWNTVPGCNISKGDLAKYRLIDGDIVFARSGSIEKAFRVSNPPESVFASYLIRGRPIEKSMGSLLEHFVKTRDYLNQIGAFGSGIAIQNVNAKKLSSIRIPIPPLNEQKRIVTRIEELRLRSRRAREALETVPDLLEQLRQSVLAAAFRGDLTKEWRKKNPDVEPVSELLKHTRAERHKRWEDAELEKLKAKGLTGDKLDEEFAKHRKQYKEPAPVDASALPELPDGWCWASVGELSDSIQYGSSLKSSKDGRIPVLRMGNLQNGEIDWSDLVYTADETEIQKYSLSPNTVLFNRTNSPELVGKTAIYRGERDAIFAGYLIRINHVPQIHPSYLNLTLNSPFIRQLCLTVKSDAVSQSNINASKLASFPIPLCSHKEQEAVVSLAESVISGAEKERVRAASLLDVLNDLDQSILSKAFRGELVLQDPNDEPASILLERIRTLRATEGEKSQGTHTIRRSAMTALTKQSVEEAIRQLSKDSFSFDELRNSLPGDYDALRDILFSLLEDPDSIIAQVFDQKEKAMRLVRRHK